MGLFDLLKNTVEGAAQVTVNLVKLPAAVIVAPLDEGNAIGEAAVGIVEGVSKLGEAEGRDDG